MIGVEPGVAQVLERGETMDITTIGRRTGQPRRVELVYHNVDGHIVISGRPGFPRSWVANLRANPRLTFHLKRSVQADLPATARVITDRAERERLLRPIARLWRIDHALMVRSAPLVEVTFD
ncbi:MAG: nitroreductase family deazaflavin-dependent oxidoreductase [Chloroflexi bacterium]|nr:nitroreductase family deazaflavin-dependent oxidoreductase [Chloroflexota bacterium]MBA3740249.1 nitroreductase family deazaflavin-dependent oxidoreductase [Chloroflexota bacterium]